MKRSKHVQTVEVVQLVKVVSAEGTGTEDDPCCYVTSFWTLDGKFVAEVEL